MGLGVLEDGLVLSNIAEGETVSFLIPHSDSGGSPTLVELVRNVPDTSLNAFYHRESTLKLNTLQLPSHRSSECYTSQG